MGAAPPQVDFLMNTRARRSEILSEVSQCSDFHKHRCCGRDSSRGGRLWGGVPVQVRAMSAMPTGPVLAQLQEFPFGNISVLGRRFSGDFLKGPTLQSLQAVVRPPPPKNMELARPYQFFGSRRSGSPGALRSCAEQGSPPYLGRVPISLCEEAHRRAAASRPAAPPQAVPAPFSSSVARHAVAPLAPLAARQCVGIGAMGVAPTPNRGRGRPSMATLRIRHRREWRSAREAHAARRGA